MALTVRTNGSGGSNIITASWFNDYYNLMTGAMTDQPVTLSYAPGSAGATPTLKLVTNGNADLAQGYNGANKVFGLDTTGALLQVNGTLTTKIGNDGTVLYVDNPAGSRRFSIDQSGNIVGAGGASFGVPISGNPPFVVQSNGAAKIYGTGVINGGNGYSFLAQLLSLGGGAPGQHIWQGTTDPAASAAEGDLWFVG